MPRAHIARGYRGATGAYGDQSKEGRGGRQVKDITYTDDLAARLQTALSPERLSTYVQLSGGTLVDALKLYVKNSAVSEAFYSPLQQVEVIVRNSIHNGLSAKIGQVWFDAFPFRFPLTDMIEKAKQSVRDDGKPLTPGRVVAALPFGFWAGLLGRHYENSLWRPCIFKAFPNRPRGFVRQDAHQALNSIRFLRNRIMHHEPILPRDLQAEHEEIIRVIGWVCPETAKWVRANSRFEQVMAEWD